MGDDGERGKEREREREARRGRKKEKEEGRKSAYEQLFVVPRCERMKIPSDEFLRIRFLFRVTYSRFCRFLPVTRRVGN